MLKRTIVFAGKILFIYNFQLTFGYSKIFSILAFLVLLTLVYSKVQAQDLEPRAYANIPIGLNFLLLGYSYSQGGISTDPASPLEDAELVVHTLISAYVHAFELEGMSSKISIVAPYACASGSAQAFGQLRERDICGLADPRFKLTVNFYGAPALSLKKFASYRQDVIVGASFQVSPPAGQYDSSKLLNIGTNRWSFEPEIGVSKAIGPLTAELAAGVTFYTENSDYFNGQTLEIDPIYSIQGHLLYNFKSGIWCALDGTYYWGGRTTIDGVQGDTLQENTRVGLTLATPINRYNSIKLNASSGVAARTGSNFDTVGIFWQKRWGGGL